MLHRLLLLLVLAVLLFPAQLGAQPPPCQSAVTPAQAQGLYDALQALPPEPGCAIGDLTTDLDHVQVTWTHQGKSGAPLRIDAANCAVPRTAPWKLSDAPALRRDCPRTWQGLQALLQAPVRTGQASVQDRAAAPVRHLLVSAPVAWPRLLLVLGLTLLLLGLSALRTRLRTGAFALPGWPHAALALAFAGLAAFALHVLDASRAACLQPGDLAWGVRGLDPASLDLRRPLLALEATWTLLLAGLDPAQSLRILAAIHLLNGALLGLLARRIGLARPWAMLAALIFVACPPLTDAFAPNSACELLLLTALLLVANAYLVRARTHQPALRWLAFGVELAAVALGLGNKESFLIYLGLLVALEGLVIAPFSWRQALSRLAPHLVLLPLLLLLTLPAILNNPTLTAHAPRTPLVMLGQLAHMVGTAAAQVLVGPFGPKAAGAVVLGVLGLLVALRRRDRMLWLGIVLLLLTALPMVVLANRPAAAYLYQPWAGLALCAAVLVAGAQGKLARALALLWLALVATSVPPPTPQACVLQADTRAAVAQLPQQLCAQPQPVWQVPTQVRESTAKRWQSGAGLLPREPDAHCAKTDPAQPLATWDCLATSWSARRHLGEAFSAVAQVERLLQMRCRNARATVK